MSAKVVSAREGIRQFSYLVNKCWTDSLRELLESKHLYQRVKFNIQKQVNELKASIPDGMQRETFSNAVEGIETEPVRLKEGRRFDVDGNPTEAVLTVANVKLFCSRCERREAFAPVWASDIADQMRPDQLISAMSRSPFGQIQMFLLVFQCQGCQGTPESFLIRREALSLRLDGRSPIETVEIPDYIPKAESKHYRDALLAMNTGRPLGAIFHLRTCIEQFARRITGIQAREPGDNLMAVYAANIPNDLSARMPSLREWYEKLSGGIHGAREDAELFCAALEAINKHFEVREVFKIPEAMSVAGRG